MAKDDGLPECLRLSRADRHAAWQLFDENPRAFTGGTGPKAPTGTTGPAFDWTRYSGPGRVSHDLGYAESDQERAARVTWLRDQEEHKAKSLERFQEKRLEQDDKDIVQAVREHEHKKKRGTRGRKRTIKEV